jgi:hypothetical protein
VSISDEIIAAKWHVDPEKPHISIASLTSAVHFLGKQMHDPVPVFIYYIGPASLVGSL